MVGVCAPLKVSEPFFLLNTHFGDCMKNDNSVVAKDNGLVAQARYRLSVNEQRVILTLISKINPEDTDFQRYTFKIDDLYKLLGLKKESLLVKRRAATKILKSLQGNIIEIVTRHPEHGGEILIMPAWIETPVFDWDKNKVTLRVSEYLKPYLLQLKEKFTSYSLSEVAHFKCAYSFRFLEFCKNHEPRSDYHNLILNDRYVLIKKYDLKDLRLTLGIPAKLYPRFYDFRKRILEPAQKEVNEKSSSYFEFEMLKKGRSITGVKLLIFGAVVFDPAKDEIPPPDLPAPDDQQKALQKRLDKLGVSSTSQNFFLKLYPPQKIENALAVVEEYQQNKKILYPTGLLSKALKEGWMSKSQFLREKEEQIIADKIAAINASKALTKGLEQHQADLEKEFLQKHENHLFEYENQLRRERSEYAAAEDKMSYIISLLPADNCAKLNTEQRDLLKLTLRQKINAGADFDILKHQVFRSLFGF
jgi:plasmid replication initiation protein